MSQHDSPRRVALTEAARHLRAVAKDYDEMSERGRKTAHEEKLLGRKQYLNGLAQCQAEKAQLLRGQADQIERL